MASREIDLIVTARFDGGDPEVRAMGLIVAALGRLDEHARRRVMRYLAARYADGVPAPAAAGTKPRAGSALGVVPRCAMRLVMGGFCTLDYGHAGSHERAPRSLDPAAFGSFGEEPAD